MEKTGYHIRVRRIPTGLITIHAPTTNWQHRPRECAPRLGFWVGPVSNLQDVEQAAQRLAERLGYVMEYCKLCFKDRHPPPPTEGDGPAGAPLRRKRRLAYTPPAADLQRKSRRGA